MPFRVGPLEIGIIAVIVSMWAAFIALIVLGIRKLSRRKGPEPKHNPLDTARERYARGEINKEEFEQLKKDLS